MTAADLVARLDGVRETGPGRWLARCPAHDDRRPSLSVRELDDGRVLIHDFGGCSTEAVVSAVGLEMRDLFPPRQTSIDGRPPERRPFPAEDILRSIGHEAIVAAIAIEAVGRGEALSTVDHERALLAAERLRDAAMLGVTS